jgi:cell division protein DivIC
MKKSTKQDGNRLIWMVLLIATLFLLGNNLSQARRILTASEQKKALEKQINLGKQKNDELEKRLSYIQSDDFVQKEAKDKLGLAEPNEVAYIVPQLPDLEALKEKKEYVPEKTNIEQWIDKFIY